MQWAPTPGAATYNLYRGLVSALPGSYGLCLQPGLVATNTTDPAVPATGTAFQYLVTAVNGLGEEGTMGFDSGGFERPNLTPCPGGPPVVLQDLLHPNGLTPDGATQGVEPARNPSIANDLTGLIGGGLYLHTGEYFAQVVDLEIPGRGNNWRMLRTYRSQISHNGQVGYNWVHNYDRRIVASGPNLLYLDGEGRQDTYAPVGGPLYEPVLQGIYAKIRQNIDGTWSMRERDGSIYHHHALDGSPVAGVLESIENRLSDRINLLYHPNGQLRTVVDTFGRSIDYFWGPNGRLSRIADYTGREVLYQYDGNGNLTSVTRPAVTGTSTANDFPSGKTTVYTYSSGMGNPVLDHNLLTITAPGDGVPVVQNIYNPSDELQTQHYGGTNATGIPAGGTYQLTLVALGGGARRSTVLDRVGISNIKEHDAEGHATKEQVLTIGLRPSDPPIFETRHTYNAQGERLTTIFPLGNQVQYIYDSAQPDRFQRGNLLTVRRIADPTRGDGFGGPLSTIQVIYQYEPMGTQQRTIIDPLGRPSTYTFDYQEFSAAGSGLNAYASAWGMNVTVPTGLGDVNGDGLVQLCPFSNPANAFGCGNPISLQQPSVQLLAGGKQTAIEGGPTQPIQTLYRYNSHGQIRVEVEPELNVKTFVYWPETDPDGDGDPTPPPVDGRVLDGGDGGMLRISTLDDDPLPHLTPAQIARRDNALNPPPTAIRNDYAYDARGNLVASIDGNGVQTAFEVNQLGQIVSVRRGQTSFRSIDNSPDPPVNGFVSRQYFNARDEIVRRSVQDSHLADSFFDVFIQVDILGNVVSMSQDVSDVQTATTQYRYDAQGRRTSITFPEGNINTLQHDERALVLRLVRGDNDLTASNGGPVGSSTNVFNYDQNGNPNQFVDGRGALWNFVHDGMDRRVRSPVVTTGALSFFDVSYLPDESINMIRVRNGGGTVLYDAIYIYDEMGRVKEARQGIRNSAGTLILGEDQNNDGYAINRYEFDRNGRRTRVIKDLGQFHDFDYDGAGHVMKTVDPLGNFTTYGYDDNNNVLQTLEVENGPTGVETRSAQSTFDRLNRKRTAVDALGTLRSFTYDARDNLMTLEDGLLNTTSYQYDAKGNRTQVTRDMRPNGHGPGPVIDTIVYKVAYDRNGRVTSMTDPGNHVTNYLYDGLDRKIRDIFDDATLIQYGYDPNDNLVSVTDANGSIISITYDGMDRPTAKNVAPVAGVHQSSNIYTYDLMNRLVNVVDQNDAGPPERATVSFAYDSLNRIRTETSQYGGNPVRSLTFTYDGNGNRRQATYPADAMTYTYDPLDRLLHVQDASAGFTADYTYIGPERIAERRHGNTTRKSYLNPPGTVDIGYDPLKRTRSIRHYTAGGSMLAGFDYTYDQENNVTSETRLHHVGRGDVWVYDSAYRLVDFKQDVDFPANEASVPGSGGLIRHRVEYTLDKVGNWLNHRIDGVTLLQNTPNNLNEYDEPQSGGTRVDDGIANDFGDNTATLPPDGVNLGHDKNGDLTREGSRTYEYDAFHRLVTVRVGGLITSHYVYDGLNRRIAKHNVSTGIRSRFIYDGDRIVDERDLSAANVEGALKRRFFTGPDTSVVAVQNVVAAQLFYIHEDDRRSAAMVTNSVGSVVERIVYDAYGAPQFQDAANNPTGAIESSIGNPFLHQGRFYDPETQFYETRGAVYAPRFGRHIQRFVPGQMIGPQVLAYHPPMVFPVPIAWIGMNPFWWCKNWFWNPGFWWGGWWAWRPFWWWGGGAWGWWRWQPWVWFVTSADWWVLRPWWGWWGAPFRWWGWQAWWGWGGWWGWWPWWGWGGWGFWMPAWGWLGWCNWWPWWGWGGWCGWWLGFGWWGWCGWWPWWNFWWCWHPWWWGGWWTWMPWWWFGWWGWSGITWWWNWWFWIAWRPWKWWIWFGWGWWWGWWGWNPWWWCGWWGWWWWGWNYGWHWWWGPYCWNVWWWGWMPWWWFGWWNWLWPWGWWGWGWWGWSPIWWWSVWWGSWWWMRWGFGWWGWGRWLGWWWPWWGWWW